MGIIPPDYLSSQISELLKLTIKAEQFESCGRPGPEDISQTSSCRLPLRQEFQLPVPVQGKSLPKRCTSKRAARPGRVLEGQGDLHPKEHKQRPPRAAAALHWAQALQWPLGAAGMLIAQGEPRQDSALGLSAPHAP